MNAQQLKNSILQEAIEGRLVPQDPNDEPASVLLERIRAEKERLVKEGKLKKKDLEVKPISEDEIPFEIPDSWEWVRLKDMVSFIGGYAYDSQSFISSSSYQVLRLGNIKNDSLLLNVNPVFISQELAEETQRFSCKDCDILITMTGTRKKRDYFYSVLIDDTHKDLFVNQRVGCLRLYNSSSAKWLIKVLKTETVLQQVFQYETGTANQGNLGAENILKTLIPLPPLEEQKRIVAKIEEVLPKVEKYGKAQDELNKLNEELPERLKKSILQEAIEGRLVPQDPNDEPASVLLEKIREEKKQLVKEGKLKKKDLEEKPISEDEIPFQIPESWKWCKIGSIFLHSSGKQLKGGDNEGTLHPYITTSNLYWDHFELGNLKSMYYKDSEIERCTAQKGDLLVCEGGDIGRSAIWPYDYTICLQNHVHRLRPYSVGYTRFIYYVMWIYKHTGLIGGKGIAIQGLSASALKDIIIPLPPLAEQHRIVTKIEKLLAGIDKLKQ